MTSENDFEIERYQATRKVEGPQFIILSGYILPETITISVLLNDANTRLPLTGQPYSRIVSKLRQNTSQKRKTTVKSDNNMINELVNKRKVKKLIGKEQIAVEMSKQSSQNTASLEARCIKIIKPKVKVLIVMKIWYLAVFEDFILTQFNALIYTLKTSYDDYRGSTIAEYYEILGIGKLRDKFVEVFFKRLE